ncbi:lysophospholipase [Neokomagataea thailandica NBRC 106555]|uniref:Lysophospholipase n=1 Tax=Neokomagataea thailandica NBRC 106555 TaxID=1223520 RepID=A0ABQ0QNW6_9PROT|nr:lysophospholipase [Neokomagataea thailandica NBRC 106555]
MRLYPSRQPVKALILALHGYGDSRDGWETIAPELNAEGITIIAPDQRGFGSTAERGHWSSTERMVEDAREIAHWVHVQYPKTSLYVMGSSMGGAVALLLTTRPDAPPIRGTILLAPAALDIGTPWRQILDGLDAIAPQKRLDGSSVPGTRVATDNMAAARRLYFDPLTMHYATIETLDGLTHLMRSAYYAAPHLTQPSLMIFGGRDQFVLPAYTTRLISRLPSTVRLDEIPSAHHLLERDKRDVARDIVSWIFTPDKMLPSGGDIAASLWKATSPP